MTRTTATLTAVGLLSVFACQRDDTPVSRRSPLAAAMARAGHAWPDSVRSEEQAFADLAEAAPSSAGLEFDADGRLLVHVRDPSDDAAAIARALAFVAQGRIRSGRVGLPSVAVVRAEYTFGELATWRDIIFARLGDIPNATYLDLNEQSNRVLLGIDPSAATQVGPLREQIASWGVDTSALTIALRRHAGISKAASFSRSKTAVRRRFTLDSITTDQDVILGGIQVYNASALGGGGGVCTLGLVLSYNGTTSALLPSHCTSAMFGDDNDTLQQAGSGSRKIAAASHDPAGYTCGFAECRGSDAALFSFLSGVSSARGLVARTTSGAGPCSSTSCPSGSKVWDTNDPYFFVVESVSPIHNSLVNKIGITTGWTYGYIDDTCVDEVWYYGAHTATCQMTTNVKTKPGDSGAPFFMFTNTSAGSGSATDIISFAGTLVGPNTEGDTLSGAFFSPASRIANDFNTITVTAPTTLTTPSATGTVLSGGEQKLTWSPVSGASKYQVFYTSWDGSAYATAPLGATTDTTITASTLYATSYNGTTSPGSGTWVRFWLYAIGGTALSAASTPIYFVTGTCTGRC